MTREQLKKHQKWLDIVLTSGTTAERAAAAVMALQDILEDIEKEQDASESE